MINKKGHKKEQSYLVYSSGSSERTIQAQKESRQPKHQILFLLGIFAKEPRGTIPCKIDNIGGLSMSLKSPNYVAVWNTCGAVHEQNVHVKESR